VWQNRKTLPGGAVHCPENMSRPYFGGKVKTNATPWRIQSFKSPSAAYAAESISTQPAIGLPVMSKGRVCS
jgi:hypothetical protein